jgi:alkaline ceramidase
MFDSIKNEMERWFQYETGHAWCESAYKYQTLPFVAEFFNSITNLPIIVLPLINVMMLKRYINEVNWMIILPHLLLTTNGIASTYYHSTLNLFGQIVDELSLVWIINIFLVAFFPVMKWYPDRFKQNIVQIRWAIVGATVFISALCFMKPSVNALALMCFSIPSAVVIYYEGVMSSDMPEATTYSWRVFVLWGMASGCWCADRFLCDVWLYLGTPYLHAAFHLLSSLAAYYVFVMFSLLDISRRAHEHKFVAHVKYFPYETKRNVFNFPYITLIELGQRKD